MKQLHMCPRNLDVKDSKNPAIEIYTHDKGVDKSYYIAGHIVFYCPYCGTTLKGDKPLKSN